jgi:hypothetical protein
MTPTVHSALSMMGTSYLVAYCPRRDSLAVTVSTCTQLTGLPPLSPSPDTGCTGLGVVGVLSLTR